MAKTAARLGKPPAASSPDFSREPHSFSQVEPVSASLLAAVNKTQPTLYLEQTHANYNGRVCVQPKPVLFSRLSYFYETFFVNDWTNLVTVSSVLLAAATKFIFTSTTASHNF